MRTIGLCLALVLVTACGRLGFDDPPDEDLLYVLLQPGGLDPAGVYVYDREVGAVRDRFDLPVQDGAWDLAYDGKSLWLSAHQMWFELDARDGTLRSQRLQPDLGGISGIAFDGQSLWYGNVTASPARVVKARHDMVVEREIAVGLRIGAMTLDDEALYYRELDGDLLLRVDLATGTQRYLGTTPPGCPAGVFALAFDGVDLLVADKDGADPNRLSLHHVDPETGARLGSELLPVRGPVGGIATSWHR